jgi:hypothetical protein
MLAEIALHRRVNAVQYGREMLVVPWVAHEERIHEREIAKLLEVLVPSFAATPGVHSHPQPQGLSEQRLHARLHIFQDMGEHDALLTVARVTNVECRHELDEPMALGAVIGG